MTRNRIKFAHHESGAPLHESIDELLPLHIRDYLIWVRTTKTLVEQIKKGNIPYPDGLNAFDLYSMVQEFLELLRNLISIEHLRYPAKNADVIFEEYADELGNPSSRKKYFKNSLQIPNPIEIQSIHNIMEILVSWKNSGQISDQVWEKSDKQLLYEVHRRQSTFHEKSFQRQKHFKSAKIVKNNSVTLSGYKKHRSNKIRAKSSKKKKKGWYYK
jgi:hypothetical protein